MESKSIYKVKFQENEKGEAREAMVREVYPSEIPGLVTLKDFVFKDASKTIFLPGEEEASKRFRDTKSIHIPYHNILFVEEFYEEDPKPKSPSYLSEVSKIHSDNQQGRD